MKCYSATVTLADGEKVEVKYDADHPVPHQAAVEAAAKAKKVPGFSQAPAVEHHRDGDPEDVPDAPKAKEPPKTKPEVKPSSPGTT